MMPHYEGLNTIRWTSPDNQPWQLEFTGTMPGSVLLPGFPTSAPYSQWFDLRELPALDSSGLADILDFIDARFTTSSSNGYTNCDLTLHCYIPAVSALGPDKSSEEVVRIAGRQDVEAFLTAFVNQ